MERRRQLLKAFLPSHYWDTAVNHSQGQDKLIWQLPLGMKWIRQILWARKGESNLPPEPYHYLHIFFYLVIFGITQDPSWAGISVPPEIKPNHLQHVTAAVPHCQQAPAPWAIYYLDRTAFHKPICSQLSPNSLVDSSSIKFPKKVPISSLLTVAQRSLFCHFSVTAHTFS